MDNHIKEVTLFRQEVDFVLCLACERKCKIPNDKYGFCKTRKNLNGKLYTCVYGDIASISANPIEKKPFFHFYPGTKALTVGSWSCNFPCPWCQNYTLSKFPENRGKGEFIEPVKFIELLKLYNCQGTSISLNEPTLLLEYALEVFKLARKENYYNTFVTNGYMTCEALQALIDCGLNAMNMDIKGDSAAVKKYCDADLDVIFRNAAMAKNNSVWIELTTLVIPGINDGEAELKEIARRIKGELGENTPWHVTAYYPAYEFASGNLIQHPATTTKTLERAREIGIAASLKYVYLGNIPGHKYENTYCPECDKLLIQRAGFDVLKNYLKSPENSCPNCSYKIDIIN
ncbi:AmmeMemoRadiSam system radical SAM enzyme [Candidatus Riflebacteria bacterium]